MGFIRAWRRAAGVGLLCAGASTAGQLDPRSEVRVPNVLGEERVRVRIEDHGTSLWKIGPPLSPEEGPHFAVLNDDGSTRLTGSLTFPGGFRSSITSISTSSDGVTIVTGGVARADGAIARGFAAVDSDGEIERFVRTSPFMPYHSTISTQGVVWLFGRLIDDGDDPPSDWFMVRRCTVEGELLGESLLKSELASENELGKDPSMPVGIGGGTFLVNVGDAAGLYSGPARTWVEFNKDGEVTVQVAAPFLRVQALAVAQDDRVFAWGQGNPKFGLHRLDTASGQWKPVEDWSAVAEMPGTFFLAGSRAGRLFFRDSERPAALFAGNVP